MGSVIDITGSTPHLDFFLPTGLGDARNFSAKRALAEADAAHAELPEVASRPAAHAATAVLPDLELLGLAGFGD